MKRIALLTVLLLALGIASGFAADAIAPTVVASATLSWGITLDKNGAGDMVNGFQNALTANLFFPLISYSTLSAKGDGSVYGVITLKNLDLDVKFDATAGTPGAVFYQKAITDDGKDAFSAEAKIVASPVEIAVWAAPGMSLDKVAAYAVEGDINGDGVTDAKDTAVSLIDGYPDIANAFTKYGTSIAYVSPSMAADGTTPNVTVTGKVLSTSDWKNATKNDYAIGADTTLVFDPITIGAGGYYSLAAGNPAPLAYATLAVALPMDPMKLSVTAASDFVLATTMDYDASAGVTFYLNSHKGDDGKPVYDSYVGADMVYVTFAGTSDLEAHAVVSEPEDNGFVDKAAFQIDAWLQNLMHTDLMTYKIKATGSYKVMLDSTNYVKPSFSVTYGKHWQLFGIYDPSVLLATAAVAFDVIPKTEITATWTSGNLGYATSLYGNMGSFVVAAKVTY